MRVPDIRILISFRVSEQKAYTSGQVYSIKYFFSPSKTLSKRILFLSIAIIFVLALRPFSSLTAIKKPPTPASFHPYSSPSHSSRSIYFPIFSRSSMAFYRSVSVLYRSWFDYVLFLFSSPRRRVSEPSLLGTAISLSLLVVNSAVQNKQLKRIPKDINWVIVEWILHKI